MKIAGKRIFDALTGLTDFTSVMSHRLYPVLAVSNVATPFSVYRLRQYPLSKDGGEFDVVLLSVFDANKATEAMDFNDKMVSSFEALEDFEFVSSEIDYVDENQQIVLMFNLKLI